MYGLINDSIRRLVVEEAGDDAWERIADGAGAGSRAFAAMHYYNDALAYALVGAASDELDAPPEVLLRRFGRYWSLEIAPESYGDYLESAGSGLRDVLVGLDSMHSRLHALFPELRPPSIEVDPPNGSDVITVHYRSEREGLASFMAGLLEGLAELMSHPTEVRQVSERGTGSDHDVFEIATLR
jgi:predicted hydrocarbon binding protein